MTDIRRTILWVVFSMSLFLIWDAWQTHNGQPSFFHPAQQVATNPALNTAPSSSALANKAGLVSSAASGAVGNDAPAVAERVVVTTDVVKATLSGLGGNVVRLELLKYPELVPHPWYSPLLALVGHGEKVKTTGQDVVLLDEAADRFYVAESGLATANGVTLPNSRTVMTLLPGDRTLATDRDSLQVKFESPAVGGVRLLKTYTFKRGDYVIDVKNEVINESTVPLSPRLDLQLVRDGGALSSGIGFSSAYTGPAIDDGNAFQKISFKDIDKRGPTDKEDYTTNADAGWVAMVQHYFASAWLVDKADGSKQPREFFTAKFDTTNPATQQTTRVYSVGMRVPLGEIAPGASKVFDANLFVGPQEENKLSALAPRLELVKDYGHFKVLSEPLFWLLTQLHKILGNWGWSIVGLVVLLKIAFYWLNAKAYSSMAKMKAVSPRITALRERMKDKPQELQKEMMRIYREEKINPLGGCLPMLVQMPVFLALYFVLLSTVEMRGAPWVGWITDLSTPDPYFILPTLMLLTSLLQTWLNPTPADPVQAKMMWIMPLVFSGMFYVFPSGLVLYYLTNNILSITQQYLINKRLGVIAS